MKILTRLSAILLAAVLMVLTACSDTSLSEGMNEDKLFTAAKDVVFLVARGDYDTLHLLLREDQRALYSPEDIANVVRSQLDDAGEFKQITDHSVYGQTISGERYAVVLLYCEFSSEKVFVKVTFDQQSNLVGFSLDRQ